MARPDLARLHLVTDDRILAGPLVERARVVVEAAGSRLALHLRGPATPARRLYEIGAELRPLCRAAGTALLVNDRPDLAVAVGADGVQLGRRSVEGPCARRIVGPERLVGSSIHSAGEALGSGPEVDFLVVGTLFPSPSHPDRTPAGTRLLSDCREAGRPMIGIGGITPDRAGAVREAGGYGVAVIRGIWAADDPVEATLDYLAALD